MNNKYSNKVIKLLKEVNPKLSTIHQIEFKNVFGAVGGYVNGRIFISCGNFGVALRLPSKTLEDLFNKKVAKHLKYFPKDIPKKSTQYLPAESQKIPVSFVNLLTKAFDMC